MFRMGTMAMVIQEDEEEGLLEVSVSSCVLITKHVLSFQS